MEQSQTKTILVNILTGGIIIGVIIVGYYVLVKKNLPKLQESNTVAQIADETTLIRTEIDETVKDLKDLDRAVASSTIIFELPEFIHLEDFTARVPVEAIGRKNPFLPTAWKLRIKALLEVAPKALVSQSPSVSAPPQGTEDTTGI